MCGYYQDRRKGMLDQRVVYLKRLLEDSGLIQYGIVEAEIQCIAARPVSETLPLLIELRKLAKK